MYTSYSIMSSWLAADKLGFLLGLKYSVCTSSMHIFCRACLEDAKAERFSPEIWNRVVVSFCQRCREACLLRRNTGQCSIVTSQCNVKSVVRLKAAHLP